MGHVVRWSTAGAVVGVAAVAAVASYEHAYVLVRAHGEAGWTGRLVPLTVDGLIYASSMVMLDSALRKTPVPALARWLPATGSDTRSMAREMSLSEHTIQDHLKSTFAKTGAHDRVTVLSRALGTRLGTQR